jgi:hypothetical protein
MSKEEYEIDLHFMKHEWNMPKPYQFGICDNLDNFFFAHYDLDDHIATKYIFFKTDVKIYISTFYDN